MGPPQFTRFTATARLLAAEARRHGLVAPGFRSPPRTPDADRTIRRFAGGGTLVAVRVRGRSPEAFEADMIDGVIAANGLTGPAADEWRDRLLDAVRAEHAPPAETAVAA